MSQLAGSVECRLQALQHFPVPVRLCGILAAVRLSAFHEFARIHQAEIEREHGSPNYRDDAQPVRGEEGEHIIDVRTVSEALTASRGDSIDVL